MPLLEAVMTWPIPGTKMPDTAAESEQKIRWTPMVIVNSDIVAVFETVFSTTPGMSRPITL